MGLLEPEELGLYRYSKQVVEKRLRKRRETTDDRKRREDRFLNFMLGLFVFLSILLLSVFIIAVSG